MENKPKTKIQLAAELKKEQNRQLREELMQGYRIALDHPIPVLAQDLALKTLALSTEKNSGIEAGWINQLAWSLNSVGANFVEGMGRFTEGYKEQFLRTARGSAYESIFHARCLNVEFLDSVQNLASMVDEYSLGMLSQPSEITEEP